MYIVTVYLLDSRMAIDQREFTFGTWQEIGLWLDHYGYNDPAYELKVRFA
jgi:thiamine phosphate synthase YjbQ (UPF0047 family)